jgi:hypothetical protein
MIVIECGEYDSASEDECKPSAENDKFDDAQEAKMVTTRTIFLRPVTPLWSPKY